MYVFVSIIFVIGLLLAGYYVFGSRRDWNRPGIGGGDPKVV